MEWQPMETAPKEGLVMLLLGNTIPDHPWVEIGRHQSGDDAEDLGYREFAKHGGWLIWDSPDNFYLIDVKEPIYWAPLLTIPK